MIQGISREIEKEKSKSSRSRRSQRVGSRKNTKQKKIVKYLVQWKEFTAEYDSWKKKKDLENAKKVVVVSRSQKVDLVSFYFLSYFYFIFDLFFIFSIFRTLGLGLEVISHISHI